MKGFRCDNLKTERLAAQEAVLIVNAVTNATLTVTAATAGGAGNNLRVVIVTGAPELSGALAAAKSGNVITVTLGTDEAGVLDNTKNTGTLVAAVLDALDDVACTTSGSGAGIVAPVAIQSLSGGHDVWSVPGLARAANLTDREVYRLESGGVCNVVTAARIASVLGIPVASLGTAL